MTEENKNMAAEAVKKEQSVPAKKTKKADTSRKIGNKSGGRRGNSGRCADRNLRRGTGANSGRRAGGKLRKIAQNAGGEPAEIPNGEKAENQGAPTTSPKKDGGFLRKGAQALVRF